jgi:hypothetical protein
MKPTNDKVNSNMNRDTDSAKKDKKGIEGQTGRMTDSHGKPASNPSDSKMKKGTDSHSGVAKHPDGKSISGDADQE